MSDSDSSKPETPHTPELSPVEAMEATVKKGLRRVRRRLGWMARISVSSGALVLVLVGLIGAAFFWASSAAFEDIVRHRMITALEDATGGRVEIAEFHWDLLHLRAEADGVTIHGLEAAGEAPYAHVDRLRVQLGLLGLFTGLSPRVILHQAEILKPEFHLIVYADGTTNQPHPKKPQQPRQPLMDTLFQAQIGHLSVRQGTLHIADQVVPLDLEGQDLHLQLQWIPDANTVVGLAAVPVGSYRIAFGVSQLAFAQGKYAPLPSRVEGSVVLRHDAVDVEQLRLVSMDQTLNLRGKLISFAHPAWQAEAQGDVDLRVLAPWIGFANTRSGVVRLKANGHGNGGFFQAQGDLASDAIHYQDMVVDAQTASFAAHFRMDTKQLLVSAIRAKIALGGEVDGEFQYDNWLDSTPAPAAQRTLLKEHKSWPAPTGVVHATLNGITLDSILRMLAIPQYQHLGLDAVVNGPAMARWTGLAHDLEIGGHLALAPSARPVPGEAPVQGTVDAAYHVESGSVKVQTLDVRLPHTSLLGTGSLGVFPITRASEMDLDFKSTDLSELDGALHALNLKQGNLVGAAALPVRLQGQADFHGQLNSSWITPRVEGRLTATNIGIEIPAPGNAQPAGSAPANSGTSNLTFAHWDSVDLDALYTPTHMEIRHGVLRRGTASLTLQGHIDSYDPDYSLEDTEPEFDGDSSLSVKATVDQFPIADLLPLAGVSAPVTGNLSAQFDVQGQLKALNGSGSVDVDKVAAYGETVDHLHAVGSVNGQQVKITSLTALQAPNGGRLTASATCDLARRSFQIDARGSDIDLGTIQRVKQAGIPISGKLRFTALGGGTLDDPQVQTKATFSSMAIAGEPVADLLVSAASHGHAVTYDLSSHQPAGQFSAHGVTTLNAEYSTEAKLEFSRFDVGALLQLLKVKGINGQSDLEGTASLSGPLAHPERLGGEASLKSLQVVVQGVHLASKGAVHATLAGGIAKLDPLEITGDDTDLKLRGTLALAGKQQLDLAADGSVNLRLAESLDPDLIASGITRFQMEAHGPLTSPILQGKVEFQNAGLALQDFPNGLSQIKGTLEFNQNRLEVRSLTAMSGGGQLSVGGYLGFQKGLYADLTATGKSIRIRYPQGISSLADASLRLQGPQNNLLLSGNVQVTRFAINSDLDMAAFAATSKGVQPIVSPDAPSNHIRFDVHLTSAPQLNFQNAYAKLAGDVDLHLRGTLASPSLLGRISLTEGSTSIGGTKYELERGDIYFNNPVRIQPNIDLDATARVEDYDITLGLHGTPDKLSVSYRSEPPLPEADVIALLALGRTQDEQSAYSQQQQQAGDNPMTDALLGGALNATVTNRVQRLFGTGAIKVDPNFIGSLGNSTARVTVVEQIGKNLTFTYASNVNTTTQQLIQAEIAINRHVSLLVTQDEAGIFSVVLKTRRRYK